MAENLTQSSIPGFQKHHQGPPLADLLPDAAPALAGSQGIKLLGKLQATSLTVHTLLPFSLSGSGFSRISSQATPASPAILSARVTSAS